MHDDGKTVTLDRKKIAQQYLKGMFIFDLLAALPLQCIRLHDIADCKYPTHTVFFFFKLFRFVYLFMDQKRV